VIGGFDFVQLGVLLGEFLCRGNVVEQVVDDSAGKVHDRQA